MQALWNFAILQNRPNLAQDCTIKTVHANMSSDEKHLWQYKEAFTSIV